jgi:hypothetical protein
MWASCASRRLRGEEGGLRTASSRSIRSASLSISVFDAITITPRAAGDQVPLFGVCPRGKPRRTPAILNRKEFWLFQRTVEPPTNLGLLREERSKHLP